MACLEGAGHEVTDGIQLPGALRGVSLPTMADLLQTVERVLLDESRSIA